MQRLQRLFGAGLVTLLLGCQTQTSSPGTMATATETAAVGAPVKPDDGTPSQAAQAQASGAAEADPAGNTQAAEPATTLPAWRTDVLLQAKTWEETQQLIASQRGKIVVMDVWSTACEPCLREFPNFVALQSTYPDDVVCLGLNCDYAGVRKKPPEFYRERVLKVLQEKEARVLNVMCTIPADELFLQLRIDSIPAVLVYDRTGSLLTTFDNRTNKSGEYTYEADVLPRIKDLVESSRPAAPTGSGTGE